MHPGVQRPPLWLLALFVLAVMFVLLVAGARSRMSFGQAVCRRAWPVRDAPRPDSGSRLIAETITLPLFLAALVPAIWRSPGCEGP